MTDTPESPSPDSAPPGPAELATIRALRQALVRLHRALISLQRIRYERENGRVDEGLRLLRLVERDPAFAWLHPLSVLIVEFDERADGDEPLTAAGARMLRDEVRAMLTPVQGAAGFAGLYDQAIQDSPDVLIEHVGLVRLLAG